MRSNKSFVERCHFLTFITEDIDQVRHIYIMACSLDAILILPTILLNILLIISLYRSPQHKKPCTKLLYSLAISDVLVGMVIEPVYFAKKIAELQHSFEVYCYTGMITYVGGGSLGCISFLNLTAIAVDRYLVVHSGTKYQAIVTNKRVVCLIIAIWLSTLVLSAFQFTIPRSVYFMVAATTLIIGVAIATFCYIKSFKTLRKNRTNAKSLYETSERQAAINSHRYKRSISTMLYVLVFFMFCYLPYLCTVVSGGVLGDSPALWAAESLGSVFVYTNSFINPIILFWRMREIRKSVALTVSSTLPSGKLSVHIRKAKLRKGSNFQKLFKKSKNEGNEAGNRTENGETTSG